MNANLRTRLVQAAFVVCWSTGFVTARYATKDNGPLTFLAIRLLLAGTALLAVAKLRGLVMPERRTWGRIALSGLALNGLYLGGVWVAVHTGMTSNLSAGLAGIHPVITTALASLLLGEAMHRRQWLGVSIGVIGVGLVLVDRLRDTRIVVPGVALVCMIVAIAGISAGTLWQRARNTGMPLVSGTALQFLAPGIVLASAALVFEHRAVHVSGRFFGSMVWAVGILSVAATLAMMWLIDNNAAATVSSLFFVTPSLSAIEAAVMFRERLGPTAIVGMVLAAFAVRLVTTAPRTTVSSAVEAVT